MKCPYCGAEVTGTKCEYCDSDITEYVQAAFGGGMPGFGDSYVFELSVTEETLGKIRNLCRNFQKDHAGDFSCYAASTDQKRVPTAGKPVKPALFKILAIPEGEEIFLIHDDTLLKTGKNGFAITESGFYVRPFLDDLIVTKFTEIQNKTEIGSNSSGEFTLKENGRKIAYCTGVGEPAEKFLNEIMDALFVRKLK